MASRHKRVWTDAHSQELLDAVCSAHRRVCALAHHAPIGSAEMQEIYALSDALRRVAIFLGHDWAETPPARSSYPHGG